MNLHVVILAAGKGTRMKSKKAKVLHPIGGIPMLAHIVNNVVPLNPHKISIVVGHGSEDVIQYFSEEAREKAKGKAKEKSPQNIDIVWVEQSEQLGTAHAVSQVIPNMAHDEQVLILTGDVPLIRTKTLEKLLNSTFDSRTEEKSRLQKKPRFGILTIDLDTPTGYGRIIRQEGQIVGVVEEKDATPQQQSIKEINTGIMAFDADLLLEGLPTITNNNAQGEYYLPDMIPFVVNKQAAMTSEQPMDRHEVEGVNDKMQLAALERVYQYQLAQELLKSGATLADPNRIDIRGTLTVGTDVFIDANVTFVGHVVLADGVKIGPNCWIQESTIANNSEVFSHSVIENSIIGESCKIGPFARLRPGTELADEVKIGNFVETKKVIVGHQSKINHLSYVGDAELGSGVNVGAGTITCNYDGTNKHKTVIEDQAFIGSNSALVAPVVVGKGATIGAGTTLTKNAPEDCLTLSRAQQKTSQNWKRPNKSVASSGS